MKYGVLLIGFEYTESKKWKALPGIPVDLYQAYNYTKNITKNILVFTDIKDDYNTTILQKAILDGYVDSGLLSFIEDIKEKKQYIPYLSTTKNGYNINNFDNTVQGFVSNLDKLIVYYTGHGKSGDIILPDNTHVSLLYLKYLLTGSTNRNCQIVSILDCCESDGMELSFNYSSDGVWKHINNNFNDQEIMCISSSHIEEDSTATKAGSIFTRLLFRFLNEKKYITINDLINNDGIYIHASYPNIRLIWGWVTNPSHTNLDISLDNINSIITINLNNCQPTLDKSSSMTNYLRYHHNNKYE